MEQLLTPPGIILVKPQYAHNVAGIVRACSVWGIKSLLWTGDKVDPDTMDRLPREERMKAYKDVTWKHVDTVKPFDHFVKDVVPVAVELKPGAEDIVYYEHTDRDVYVFGPENGSLGPGICSYCHKFVIMPTKECLNLSAAVNVVLYDRHFKTVRERVFW